MSNSCNSVSINTNQKKAAFWNPKANSNAHYALPDELYLEIFSYLSPVDLFKVTHTTREGRRLGYDSQLWKDTAEKVSLFMEDGMKAQIIQELEESEEGFSYYQFTKQAMEGLFPQVLVHLSSQVSPVYVDPVERLAQGARGHLSELSQSSFSLLSEGMLPPSMANVLKEIITLRKINLKTLSYQDLAEKERAARIGLQSISSG